jgi:ABC-2 type transporter
MCSPGGLARGSAVSVAVTSVPPVFHPLNIHSLWVMFSMILLTAILFSLAGFINGVYATSFDGISIVPTFVLTPLTYLGGIFYSISLLPEFWQTASWVSATSVWCCPMTSVSALSSSSIFSACTCCARATASGPEPVAAGSGCSRSDYCFVPTPLAGCRIRSSATQAGYPG